MKWYFGEEGNFEVLSNVGVRVTEKNSAKNERNC